jgi:hypothetical protein
VPRIDRADLLQLGKIRHADLSEVARGRRAQVLQLGDLSLHTAQLGGGA